MIIKYLGHLIAELKDEDRLIFFETQAFLRIWRVLESVFVPWKKVGMV